MSHYSLVKWENTSHWVCIFSTKCSFNVLPVFISHRLKKDAGSRNQTPWSGPRSMSPWPQPLLQARWPELFLTHGMLISLVHSLEPESSNSAYILGSVLSSLFPGEWIMTRAMTSLKGGCKSHHHLKVFLATYQASITHCSSCHISNMCRPWRQPHASYFLAPRVPGIHQVHRNRVGTKVASLE